MTKLVAVTGATGFVGPHLVAALSRRGWRLRLLVRRWTPLPSLAGVDAEMVPGRSLLRGSVAPARRWGGCGGSCRRTDQGTRRPGLPACEPRQRRAAVSAGARRPPGPALLSGRPRAAAFCLRREQACGRGSRRDPQRSVDDRSGAGGLRPRRPRDPGLLPSREVGRCAAPRLSAARLSLIHVADLAEALALTVERPPPNATYEVDDGQTYTYADMAEAAGEALGRRPWRIAVPREVMACVAGWNGFRQALGGDAQILTRGKVNEIFHADWSAQDRRLAAAIGLQPRYTLASGFRDTILWYRAKGWL